MDSAQPRDLRSRVLGGVFYKEGQCLARGRSQNTDVALRLLPPPTTLPGMSTPATSNAPPSPPNAASSQLAVLAARWDAIDALVAAVTLDPSLRADLAERLAARSGIDAASLRRLLADWTLGWSRPAMAARARYLVAADRLPVGVVAVIAPGNLPVATFTAAIEALALGCAVRVRPGSGDPDAVDVLRALLAGVAPTLAAEVAAFPCDRDDDDGWRALLGGTSSLVVFGDDASLAAVRHRARSLGFSGPVRGHGAKLSVALIEHDDVAALAVDPVALDGLLEAAWLADGRGCLSLRSIVVRGADAASVALYDALVARADDVARRFPEGVVAPHLRAQRRQAIEADRLAAALGDGRLAEGVGWALACRQAPRGALDPRMLGPGARFLRLISVAADAEWPVVLARLNGHLAAVAVPATVQDAARAALAEQLKPLGVARVCAPIALQSPPFHAHDGVEAGEMLRG